jgi:hypothetical protein
VLVVLFPCHGDVSFGLQEVDLAHEVFEYERFGSGEMEVRTVRPAGPSSRDPPGACSDVARVPQDKKRRLVSTSVGAIEVADRFCMGTGHDVHPYRVEVVWVLGFRNEQRDDRQVLIKVGSGRESASRAVEGGLVMRLAHHGETTVGRQTSPGQEGTRGRAGVTGS